MRLKEMLLFYKVTEAQRDQGHEPQRGRVWVRICLLVSSHAPSFFSRKVDWGGELEIPTKTFCLMVNQNAHRTRIPTLKLLVWEMRVYCIYSCNIWPELFCVRSL